MSVYRLHYLETSFWETAREISHEHLEPTATWGAHSMRAPLVLWCADTNREGASMRQRKEEREATKAAQAPLCRALQFGSGMVSPHQHQSIISTSCWDRKVRCSVERSHSSGSSWSHTRYTHTHTHAHALDVSHSNMTAPIWNIISSVRLCLSAAQKVFFPFASPLTRYMLRSRTFSAPFQTLHIDYLALVDPVDVKTFWIHLHGHRYSLCGVLDRDSGMRHGMMLHLIICTVYTVFNSSILLHLI